MFRQLRLKRNREPIAPEAIGLTAPQRLQDPNLPVSLKSLNNLDEVIKQRIYRVLLPPALLTHFDIDPIGWKGPDKYEHVQLYAEPETRIVKLSVRHSASVTDPFLFLELADNRFNGIDLNFLVLSNPNSPRFDTDVDAEGNETLFGTVRRNVEAEEAAMHVGLAPGQVREGLRGSQAVFQSLEVFLAAAGHRAYYLEPLTYVSAWVFEKRGFAYVSGHKLMDEIHHEFHPGGQLNAALDGSSPFRQPEQWRSVRGRAWAIQDGILEVMDGHWDGLRMVKRLGRHARVETFPGAEY
jgi:hypothetical protein